MDIFFCGGSIGFAGMDVLDERRVSILTNNPYNGQQCLKYKFMIEQCDGPCEVLQNQNASTMRLELDRIRI
jgi:hypothetical protein